MTRPGMVVPLLRNAAAFLALALALVLLSVAPEASAEGRASVTWTHIDVPEGETALAKALKKALEQAARKANFGTSGKLELWAKVVEFSSEQKGDVHRVTCTIVGRVPGGPSAKSRISFGGSPTDKAKLEKQVLAMVAHAVVTRLAEIVRTRDVRR